MCAAASDVQPEAGESGSKATPCSDHGLPALHHLAAGGRDDAGELHGLHSQFLMERVRRR